MDIPLPGEPDPQLAKHSAEPVTVDISSPHNIPLPSPRGEQLPRHGEVNLLSIPPPLPPPATDPEDSNRYSPSRATDDDLVKDDPPDQDQCLSLGSTSVLPTFGTKGVRTTVLGKAQAKKRLLAFSMTKQGGGQGLSFGFNKKALNKMSTGNMPFAGTSADDDAGDKEKDDKHPSPKKKIMAKKGVPRDDKARAVVSAIEEIKREEMLMRGVLGYGTHIGSVDQPYSNPLVSPALMPAVKPREELEMSNILSEQQKGAIEELLGSLLTHDSRKSKDEEKERRRSDDRRKRDSEKSSRHSKERHRSKERHSRSGRDREKEEKKHRPSELPKNWQQFRDRGFKFEEIRRLKLKLEKDMASNNRERIKRSRDREHRSRSSEKRHKSPGQPEEKERINESDHDIMSKPFETTSRLIYPFMAVGIRQMQKQYPRSLIRFTKTRPAIPFCENPTTSKAFYRTREEILFEASERVVELMQCVINGDLCKNFVKNERNFKTKQTADANLSNSLAALQVSYDETEIDENMSSSDDTNGNRRERPWFLPENMVVWSDREETCIGTSSDAEINIKRERNEESDEENYRKKDGSLELAEVKESDFISSERERDIKVEPNDSNISMKSGERTTVRSKWDSDYEDDKGHDDIVIQNSCAVLQVCEDTENWDRKENEKEYEFTSVNEVKSEKLSKSGSESDGSNVSSSESSSANESNAEDSPNSNREDIDERIEDTIYEQNHKSIDKKGIDSDAKRVEKLVNSSERENSLSSAQPESGEGSTNLKLASEYEEFMKAVSFESSTIDNGQEDVSMTEQDEGPSKELDSSPIFREATQSRHSDEVDSEASHDKLDIEPAYIEEPHLPSAVSESKVHVTPKLMTSSASEDELTPSEEKQLTKEKVVEVVEQTISHPKRERKHRSSSSESSSSSDSSHESEELKEKRKSKSKKLSKKKRKKVIRSKKKQKKTSKKKRVESSSSSDSDSSSDKDSSSSSSSEEVSKKKTKHKEKKRRAKSSSSEESDNDSSSDNLSSDNRNARKKKKKKKAKKIIKKKPSKKKRRSRKDSESSDSDENISRRRSKSSRHKISRKEISKDNNVDQSSEEEKVAAYDSNASSEHREDDSKVEHGKKLSRRKKSDTTEVDNSHKKTSKKYKGDHTSGDDSGMEEREKKSGSRKKSNSNKKSSNYHGSESSEDESERKAIKKRRRERRSCTTSPVVSLNKKRRRSPSTSSEHSPTPQRRNSAEGKSFSQRENSKEQSSSSRKLKHSSGGNKKGHKQKDLEESEHDDSSSEDTSLKRNRDKRDFRSHNFAEENDWDVNSDEENREINVSQIRVPVDTDIFSQKSPQKVFSESYLDKTRSENIKKEIFSDDDLKSCNMNVALEIVDKTKYVPVSSRRQSFRCLDANTDDDNSDIDFQRRSSLINAEASNVVAFADMFSHIQVKTEPKETSGNYSTKDNHKSVCVKLFSPSDLDDDSKTLSSKSQLTGNRDVCSTDSSQLSQGQEKVCDKYESDKSGDSLRDVEETQFNSSVLLKQKFSNIVEENVRGTNRESSGVKTLPTRGTNFVLDNIPLPPLNISRDSSSQISQKLDLSDNSRIHKGNSKTLNIISNFSSDISTSPGLSFKALSQRPVVSFKLLSPSNLLPSSQALVDTSVILNENKTSQLDNSKVIGKVPEDLSESGKKITAENIPRGATVFESSKDDWSDECSLKKPIESSDTECAVSEVSSSSSKISVEANFEKLTSSANDINSKERSRKRPSRWGMTTAPPKKKVVEDLYESLTAARREVELSPNINKFYDEYLSNIEETGSECIKENLDTSVDSQKKINENKKCVSDKEIGSDTFLESNKVSSWELPESVEKTDTWEENQDKHKNKYDPQKEKKREKHVKKINKEDAGSLIDWEKDLEDSKEIKTIIPIMKDVNLLHCNPEPEVPNLDARQLIAPKGLSSQEESGSEWESKDESLNLLREPSFRESDERINSKERTRREKQEMKIEKSVHRRINFDDGEQWEDQRWHDANISTENSETYENRGQHIESKNSDSQKNVTEKSKRKLEEARIDEAYRDVQDKDHEQGEEKARVDESVSRKEKEWYKYQEHVEKKNDSCILGDIEAPSKIPVMYTEGPIFDSEECVHTSEHEKHQEGNRDKILNSEGNIQDSNIIENKDLSKTDYVERGKLDVVEKDRSKSEDRARKYSGEREHRENDEIERRHDERSRKEYPDQRSVGRERDKRESETREPRHEDSHVRKDYADRERSSTRDRDRRDTRSDRRDERRRERDRRSDRRDRDRWERDKRDRLREEREPRRSRSPAEYHHEHEKRENRIDERERERDRSQSPPPEYWQGDWARIKERNCDSAGNYYVQDIPLPINSTNASGSGIWTSRGTGEIEMELSCSPASSPLVGFKRSLADSTISDSELVSCKQEDMTHRPQEMSPSSSAYCQTVVPGKVFDRKSNFKKQQTVESSPPTERPPTPADSPAFSPKRLSLDERLEMELGVKNTPAPSSVPQYQIYQHQQPPSLLQHPPPPQQQHQQSQFAYSQYYTHVPPPTQFDARSDKYMNVPPPPYGQSEEYGPPQHMYPPPNVKSLLPQMRPPSLETSAPKRRPPLLPTPTNIRPMINWDSPEAFIGNQPPPSSRVVQVGNVLQVVPLEVPPPVTQGQVSSQQSIVLQSGNVLQVIPSESMSPSVPCSEPPPVSSASSQVVQVGNVLQVIPGPTTPSTSRSTGSTSSKSTFPPTSSHSSPHGIPPHLNVMPIPSMHGPPPSQGAPVHPSPTQGPITHPPPSHGPPNHPPPPHSLLTQPPPTHRALVLTPPIRVPVQTPPIQIPSIHGIPALPQSPTPGGALLKSPSLEMSPSPVITSPLVSMHVPVPPPAGMVQVVAVSSPAPIPETVVVSNISPVSSGVLPAIVPTPVAAPISYSPPASPFLVPPAAHPPVLPGGVLEATPVMQPQGGDCPIPFLSSVELAQASQMEEVERRRAEKLRRRAEREKRRKEKEKRNQLKLKQATEMIIKQALEQDNEMLGSASDIDIEEMRLIEEAMQQVPEQEEEFPQTDPEQLLKKKKKKVAVEIKPLPPAGKGILVSPGFREKPPSSSAGERKSVKFADGIRPGEGTSPSAGEDLPSPPPPPRKLPKEKRYKKKKKKKIKVKIIRQINVEDEDEDDEDISPPPPPPGSPPPPPMYPPGAHYPSSYPPGFTYTATPPFTVLPGVDSSTGAATGTGGNIFTPLYHQHHHTTTTTHTTTVQFAPPPPVAPVTPVPPPTPNPHLFKRESKSNP